ncbi:hypothetical protein A2872_04255 [Candidatus Gottesmanbacteria bacterium RIFCSPHIGHO2_01_FULL_42_12]|uniref:Uncharacterized protein n=1 Tax=Candidatus Gottesmanbacteria bacterium RIFCSPHIGHO2_01_FULL_42_12 TaxID=1798377 RepID=A0A1F5Z1C7_9BACT|nr:MAG: hypothetical protein A2872_04255 [Candidatus Gottesmanbacteria bacterium RIFCSPHIGHO2_01_FULL_42_12]
MIKDTEDIIRAKLVELPAPLRFFLRKTIAIAEAQPDVDKRLDLDILSAVVTSKALELQDIWAGCPNRTGANFHCPEMLKRDVRIGISLINEITDSFM